MDQKRVTTQMGELVGGMTLLFTVGLVYLLLDRPDIIKTLKAYMAPQYFAVVGLIGLGWIVTVGLFLGQRWARFLAGVAAVLFLVEDYFLAAAQISGKTGAGPDEMGALSIRLSVMAEVLFAAWALTLLYLLFSPRSPEPAASSISVEVLNTK